MKNKEQEEAEMSFLEHLEVFRWHIIRSLLAVFIFALLAFIFHRFIFDEIILAPKFPEFFTNQIFCQFGQIINLDILCINTNDFPIINLKMGGQLSTHILVSFVVGIIAAFPYVFWEFWQFIKPAFLKKEKKYTKRTVFTCSSLFSVGVAFGYFIILPLSIHFLSNYNISSHINNNINLSSYISTVISIVLACGVIFELPVIIFFLTKVGLVTPIFLKKHRRHAIIIILILSAIITPPDIFSQILVSFPLTFLYELSIKISKKVSKKQKTII